MTRTTTSRTTVHTVDDAPEQSRDELRALQQQFGKVINIHGAMAASPVVLQSYVALQQVIGDYGTFDAATREAVALAVGHVDECTYCQSAHTMGAQAAGLTEDQTVSIRNNQVGFDPTAAAQHPELGDGYAAALTNFRYIASAVLTTEDALQEMSR